MGIRAHSNFVADPEIAGYAVMARRNPCFCGPCKERFKKPVGERYKNPCDDCEYWEMYRGLNDWRKITFEPATNCDGDEMIDSLAFTLRGLGERMKNRIVEAGFGAYHADGKYSYYLVQWTEKPWQIESDCVKKCGAEYCQLFEGDWVCHGKWLNYVPYANHWYTVSEVEVLVRCQTILHSDVKLAPHSHENKLPGMNPASRAQALALNPLRVTDEDHDFLMDAASLMEGLDYEVDIPDASTDDEGDAEDDEEEEYLL